MLGHRVKYKPFLKSDERERVAIFEVGDSVATASVTPKDDPIKAKIRRKRQQQRIHHIHRLLNHYRMTMGVMLLSKTVLNQQIIMNEYHARCLGASMSDIFKRKDLVKETNSLRHTLADIEAKLVEHDSILADIQTLHQSGNDDAIFRIDEDVLEDAIRDLGYFIQTNNLMMAGTAK